MEHSFTDADWKEPRKHLNLAFNLNVLKGFLPIFSSYSDLTVQELQENAGGEDFDVFPYIVRLIFRTVSGELTPTLSRRFLIVSLKMTRENLFLAAFDWKGKTSLCIELFMTINICFVTVSATLLNVHRYELRSFEELYSNINKWVSIESRFKDWSYFCWYFQEWTIVCSLEWATRFSIKISFTSWRQCKFA